MKRWLIASSSSDTLQSILLIRHFWWRPPPPPPIRRHLLLNVLTKCFQMRWEVHSLWVSKRAAASLQKWSPNTSIKRCERDKERVLILILTPLWQTSSNYIVSQRIKMYSERSIIGAWQNVYCWARAHQTTLRSVCWRRWKRVGFEFVCYHRIPADEEWGDQNTIRNLVWVKTCSRI